MYYTCRPVYTIVFLLEDVTQYQHVKHKWMYFADELDESDYFCFESKIA